jgi:transposase
MERDIYQKLWTIVNVHIVNGNMNAALYKNVLETRLLPQLQEWFPDRNCVFMQDGAPCHTANVIMNYFHDMGLEVLPWPGNSPNINPIEGIWHNLKNRVNEVISTSKRDLIQRIINVWHHNADIGQLIIRYYASMPNRIKTAIKAKGGVTKY